MGGSFWTIQQVAAFVVVAATACGVVWRLARGIATKVDENHAKLDALESLIASDDGPISTGALRALRRIERRVVLTSAQVRLAMEEDERGYVETDAEGMLTHVNARWMAWTDMTLAQARGRGWVFAVHPGDRERVRREWEDAVRDERDGEFEFRYVDSRRKETSVHARSTVVRDDHTGEVIGYIALISEVFPE